MCAWDSPVHRKHFRKRSTWIRNDSTGECTAASWHWQTSPVKNDWRDKTKFSFVYSHIYIFFFWKTIKIYSVAFILYTWICISKPSRKDVGTGWKRLSYADVLNSISMSGPLDIISGKKSPPHTRASSGKADVRPSYTDTKSCMASHWFHVLRIQKEQHCI